MMDNILLAREDKITKIKSFLSDGLHVITIKSNIPGKDKHIKEAYVLCNLFFDILDKNITSQRVDHVVTADGPIIYIAIKQNDSIMMKKMLIELEDTHPLGRFIDLDYYISSKSISRLDLGYPFRPCYLCHEDAHLCARMQKHAYNDLISFIKKKLMHFLNDYLTETIDFAMMKELSLEDKFGCVTLTSSGSHPDMNADLMISSKSVITPYFLKIFELSFCEFDHEKLLIEARKIGLDAETAMYNHTKGINTYKGLIFLMGFMMLALSKKLTSFSNESLFEHLKDLSKPVIDDFSKPTQTFGMEAYLKYGIKGVRGEILSGLSTLQKMMKKYPFHHLCTDIELRTILIEIIISIDDTVLLKRAGSHEAYINIKKQFIKLERNSICEIKRMNDYMIDQSLSVGGSADMLICYLFLKQVQENLYKVI